MGVLDLQADLTNVCNLCFDNRMKLISINVQLFHFISFDLFFLKLIIVLLNV